MTQTLQTIITDIGLDRVFNASNNGLQAQITHIALGDGSYSPDAGATALVNERQRVPVADTERLSNNQIRLAGLADGDLEYWVSEVGVFLEDGTLFAVWSDPSKTLGKKVEGASFTLAFNLALERVSADDLNIVVSGAPVNLFFAGPLAQIAAASITAMDLFIQQKCELLEKDKK